MKRRIDPMLGGKRFERAVATIAGLESLRRMGTLPVQSRPAVYCRPGRVGGLERRAFEPIRASPRLPG